MSVGVASVFVHGYLTVAAAWILDVICRKKCDACSLFFLCKTFVKKSKCKHKDAKQKQKMQCTLRGTDWPQNM